MDSNTRTLMATNYLCLLLSSFFLASTTTTSSLLHLLLGLLRRLLFSLHPRSHGPPVPVPSSPSSSSILVGSAPPPTRALSHVLAAVSAVPAASRKYYLIRSLADRLIDDNNGPVYSSPSINALALSEAFRRTVGALEAAVAPARERGPLEKVMAAVRRWEGAAEDAGGEGKVEAEKMAAEVGWLAVKMTESGEVEEAVRWWGEAAGLARAALTAEPRVQVAFVKVSVFLLKHANAKQFGRKIEEESEYTINRHRMALLTSWLPLLCQANNGTDAPIMSSNERAEMVNVLEEMIEKLNREQQEEVLALWLHHFSSCPDSDWPNLESCYMHWYSLSRDCFLKQLSM